VIRRQDGEPVGPLDEADPARIADHVIEAELDQLGRTLEAIQIATPRAGRRDTR
jgi:hypothetical protein